MSFSIRYSFFGLVFILCSSHGIAQEVSTSNRPGGTYGFPVSERKLGSREFLSFGFVLMPEYSEVVKINRIAEACKKQASELLDLVTTNLRDSDYVNVSVGFPHSSVGHYGVSGVELPELKRIVDGVASEYAPVVEPMAQSLTVTGDNVSWYSQNIGKNTNPSTVQMYLELRDQVRVKCHTLSYSHSAQFLRYKFRNDPKEKEMLEALLQNWGTPEPVEAPRIRPHFTLLYSHSVPQLQLGEKISKNEELLAQMKRIPEKLTFSYLAIVELDAWGNPIGNPLYIARLVGGK